VPLVAFCSQLTPPLRHRETMQHPMALPAKPLDIQWAGIVGMMYLRLGAAAASARLAL